MDGRRMYWPRGRGAVLADRRRSTPWSISAAIALDYDRWAGDPALSHWSYAHVLPYFRKARPGARVPMHIAAATAR